MNKYEIWRMYINRAMCQPGIHEEINPEIDLIKVCYTQKEVAKYLGETVNKIRYRIKYGLWQGTADPNFMDISYKIIKS